MASPAVGNRTETALTTAGTSRALNNPINIVSGNLLLHIVGWNADPGAITFTGWTQVTGGNTVFKAFYRQADGTEGATATISWTNSAKLASTAYRITGHEDPATQAPELQVGSGSSANPDPPSISPTGGSKDYLFIAALQQAGEEADDDTWVSAVPTGYTSTLQKTSGTGGAASSNCSVASVDRQATTATEDPATFTTAQSLAWVGMTIAVHPPGAGGDVTATVSTVGAVTFTGQTVGVVETVRATISTLGAVTFAGQTVTTSVAVTVQVATPGAVTFTGQSLTTDITTAVAPGAVTFTGQTVATSVAVTVQVTTPGAVTFTGQAVTEDVTTAVTSGAVTFTGQTVTTRVAVVATVAVPGAVTFTGQNTLQRFTAPLTPGAVTFQGQTVGAGQIITVPVDPGALTLAGQQVALAFLEQIAPGGVTFTGQTVTTAATGVVGPLIWTHEGPESGGAAAGAVLIVTHEGDEAGGAPSGTVRVVTREGP